MRVVVQKYGGSSVSDLDKIRAVADRIARTAAGGVGVVVVVSAMGNTTNELIALATELSSEPDRRELDMLISVGERISMALVAMALRDRGVDAVSLTGSQSGIITDDSHADARVVEVRPARVQECLEAGKVVIVAGFQGVSRSREITTLGRGGSDTTAVVLAAALGAEHCEICSDVDGVFSADPRLVLTAAKLDTLSLDEALGLARGGAKVLFEDAVRYARDHGVELHASATFGPGSGTRIVRDSRTVAAVGEPGSSLRDRDSRTVAAVGEPGSSLRDRDSRTRVHAVAVTSDVLERVRPAADDLARLERAGAQPRRVLAGEVWLDTRNVHGRLPELGGERCGPVGVVSAVGSGFGEQAERIQAVAAELGSTVYGSAGDVAWWAVEVAVLADAVRTVHDRVTR